MKELNFDYPHIKLPRGTGLCLDIGCGSGSYRKFIENAGYVWVGVDVPDSHGEGKIVEGDAHLLPFKSEVFNCIWMNCVLEHMRNPWIALSELYRVLAKGGVIAGTSGYLDPDSTHMCALTEPGHIQVLTDTGFKDIEVRPGTIAFPVILRKYFMYLLGNKKLSTSLAFIISKIIFIPLYKSYCLIRMLRNFLLGRNFDHYKKGMNELNYLISRDFAAYLIFRARKGN